MTITLPPEIENAIAEKARQQANSPEQIALDGLRTLFVPAKMSPDQILELAAEVYAGLSTQEIADIEKIALDRSNFVGQDRLTGSQ